VLKNARRSGLAVSFAIYLLEITQRGAGAEKREAQIPLIKCHQIPISPGFKEIVPDNPTEDFFTT